MNPFGQAVTLDGASDQFRLTRIQTFNWGTFANVFDFPIPREGYLFVGPSGSGKSTVLDAHAALMTPPKWVDFNVAARENERHGKDRSVMTYLRGAWATQTSESGEAVKQYVRTGTTWSAISETYRNEQGRVVTLAQVLWVRGNATAPTEASRVYLTMEREFNVQELDFFPTHDFDVRRFKTDLPEADMFREFSGYQERFQRLLGIDNERALRLLHKTQSAKDLGDLNFFLRDFMLDAPETFKEAAALVEGFGTLNEAHQRVVAAREQVETLIPAQLDDLERQKAVNETNVLREVAEGLDHYKERRRREMLRERIAELKVDMEGSTQAALRLGEQVEHEFGKLTDMQQQRLGMGGGILEQLQRDLAAANAERPERLKKRDLAVAACTALGWAMPDTPVWFVQIVEKARQRVLNAGQLRRELEGQKDELKGELKDKSTRFTNLVTEIKAMQAQDSNIPARLLGIRQAIAADLGIDEAKLPFVGELLEVKSDAADWQGAIERVMGGFARSILVDDRYYGAVSTFVNSRHLGTRLAYFRVMSQTSGNQGVHPSSLVRKLNIAPNAHADWLREELKTHFDFECADSLTAFRASRRAVTKEGLVKHNTTRHEKNDRDNINDRSQWVLGFDNHAKLALYQEDAAKLGARISEIEAQLRELNAKDDERDTQALLCQTLANMSWNEVDVATLLDRVTDLTRRIDAEKTARPDLARMDDLIKRQDEVHREAVRKKNEQDIATGAVGTDIRKVEGRLLESESRHQLVAETPTQLEALNQRFARYELTLTFDNIDSSAIQVERALSTERNKLNERIIELKNAIVQRFAEFNRRWLAESDGLDPTIESAPDYFGKLARLQNDRLPEFEERFFALLREQSDRHVSTLATKVNQERAAIRQRMELVNESLKTAPFNPGTHLVIDTKDKVLEEVVLFRATLKEALSYSFGTLDKETAEKRFKVLQALVKRLASHESVDLKWRNLVLDVRQHVEFIARELDVDGLEVEVYHSGAGKSGGQRQKLAATCLAAALRYQLGGQDRALPSYPTVALDEAFDKADQEFTAMAMNIFKTFGFQTIIATPMKNVMTLEPFIGGACFVHIKDRKRSTVIPIDYDDDAKRLKLSPDLRHAEEAAVD
ncbi:MAG TPA: SbcC/MukB-like Walker B domain-containing protein [Ideonella sp.]|uniref:ATP-binding protein n=1 Tax=Ideonella sp. TaxID=1929293 RepID=UPI002C7B832A|nr:SbcC/MukB-like Walker B domain-containing protein [Ideonella sp.]HSI49164.1 SbcC/MukB-like Walker B domain-containing protein [Ideonella sp.]